MTRISPECQATLSRIRAYLDGELDAPACASIERHCQTCPHCAAVVAGLQDTVGLCHKAGATPLPDDVRARARARVQQLLDES